MRTPASTRLAGDFNVANALAALAAAGEAGFDVGAAVAGLASVQSVAGRLERIEAGQPFAVVVDYAHKPDAVDGSARRAARRHARAGSGSCSAPVATGTRASAGSWALPPPGSRTWWS